MIRVKTNITDVVSSLKAKFANLERGAQGYDSMMRTVATSLIGKVKMRIHEQGKAADGSAIGTYSTSPIYVSSKANPGRSFGRPIGKTGKSKFKSGKRKGEDHASRYFPGGYNEYKTTIGRNQLGTVNLSLSGQLNNQLTIQATAKGYGYGWPDKEKLKRANALEKKYGKYIYGLTEEELQMAMEVAKKEVMDALS